MKYNKIIDDKKICPYDDKEINIMNVCNNCFFYNDCYVYNDVEIE